MTTSKTTVQQMVGEIAEWASTQGCTFHEGEVGFGRPCVGVLHLEADAYPDWRTYDADYNATTCEGAAPDKHVPNAYHKHPCLAVLIDGGADRAEAIRQLHHWVMKLKEAGVRVVTTSPDPHTLSGLMGSPGVKLVSA